MVLGDVVLNGVAHWEDGLAKCSDRCRVRLPLGSAERLRRRFFRGPWLGLGAFGLAGRRATPAVLARPLGLELVESLCAQRKSTVLMVTHCADERAFWQERIGGAILSLQLRGT